ncbi:hypothetical protein IFR05_014568 [Cadophora sp. M221]|nr:hypothetical protein IFR05_014568 [Cadophora sp. M221]
MFLPLLVVSTLLLAGIPCIQAQRIDTHIHALPQAYLDAQEAAGGDPTGTPTPSWSIDATMASMDSVNSSIAILSVSAPGVPIAGTGRKARQLARTLNAYLGNISTDTLLRKQFGFFGSLPDWEDVDGTLVEIDYLFGQQKLCSGVVVFTTYGDKLLGHRKFVPIWKKLQQYKALVFIHPTLLAITPKLIGAGIPQPITDFLLATTRTVVDLVMTGTVRSCPDVDIVLSHAGGTIPFVGTRAIGGLLVPAVAAKASVTFTQAAEDFGRFYYDIALSTSPAQLDGLLDWSKPGKILFGSDFPFAPSIGIASVLSSYNGFVENNARGQQLAPEVLRANALSLLNKHSLGRHFS